MSGTQSAIQGQAVVHHACKILLPWMFATAMRFRPSMQSCDSFEPTSRRVKRAHARIVKQGAMVSSRGKAFGVPICDMGDPRAALNRFTSSDLDRVCNGYSAWKTT